MKAIGRAVRALVVLVVVLVGPPWALVRFVGNPLPRTWPRPSGVIDTIERSGVDPAAVVRVLAVVVWLAWIRLAVAIVVEALARRRNRPVPHLPGMGSAQRWAASLLASLTIVSSGMGAVRSAGAVERVGPAPAITLAWSGGSLSSDGSEFLVTTAPPELGVPARPPTANVPVSPSGGAGSWTVERNDSWWRIAERTLGDGLRWQEVRDANLGREVAPGVVFTSPDLALRPGWTIVVPGIGDAPSGPSPTVATPAAATVTVAPGDTLSELAETHLGDADAWTELWAANHGRSFPDGRTFSDPDLLRPGWVLDLPGIAPLAMATDEAPDAEPAPPQVHRLLGPTADTPDPAAGVATPAASCAPFAPTDDLSATPEFGTISEGRSTAPLGIASATVLATAGLGLIRFRRRRELRSARAGEVVSPPEPAMIRMEQRLVAVAADEVVARLDLAVRGAVAHLRERAADGVTPPPLVATFTAADGSVELVFDGTAPAPPPPWLATPAGWSLPAEVPTPSIPAGGRFAPFPCPALVHLGRVGGRDLHVDLEAVGTLGIEGSRRHARSIVHHVVATAALGAYGDHCRVIATGLDPSSLAAGDTAESFDTLDDAIERAAELVTPVLGVLRLGETAAMLRAGSAGEPWETVVLAAGADRVVGPAGAELTALGATPGRGLAVVTDAPGARTRWKLRQLDSTWRLDPLGLDVQPVGVDTDELVGFAALVASAAAPAAPSPDPASRTVLVGPPTEWSMMVHTFGRPRITTRAGVELEFTRTKALELVVWLARHRSNASRSGARAALWDVEVANGTFANVVSDARQSLSAAIPPSNGEFWLGRSVSERLELHPAVVTDVELLDRALRQARRQGPGEARVTLAGALALVTGVPFTATPFLWPDAEGLVSQDTLLATTAAAELAELCLAANDLDGVFAATGVGLLVLPGHEELLALRMRAQAARGDLASVKREWEGYERVIAGDPLGDGEPSARLVQLRNDLLGSRRR